MPHEVDVTIIGAGAAGLAAAKELTRLGKRFMLIEGSPRIGGRAHTVEIAQGVWFDRGCAWLVEGEANPFVPIADALGIPLRKTTAHHFQTANLRLFQNKKSLSKTKRAEYENYFKASEERISMAAQQGNDLPLSDVLELANEFAIPFRLGVATGWGNDVEQISTVDYNNAYGELGFPAVNGYGNLVAAWGADVPVALNCAAKQIDWHGASILVETSRGTIKSRSLLCTVSTGVLAAGDIQFSPSLPDWKLEAIHKLPMGVENRIGVYFNKNIFGPDGKGHYSSWASHDESNSAKVEAGIMAQNTAVVFAGGQRAVTLEQQGAEASGAFAVDRIADIFGNDIRKHVIRSIATAWKSEPWARGSWACAMPGHAHQRANLARPLDNRIFFAGEATADGLQGTCHGAYFSGMQTAREIAESLAPR